MTSLTTEIAQLKAEVALLQEREQLLIERTKLQKRAIYFKVAVAVCRHWNIGLDQLFATTRVCADARQAAMDIALGLGASTQDCCEIFGRCKDNVEHAQKAVRNKLLDKTFASRYHAARKEVENHEENIVPIPSDCLARLGSVVGRAAV